MKTENPYMDLLNKRFNNRHSNPDLLLEVLTFLLDGDENLITELMELFSEHMDSRSLRLNLTLGISEPHKSGPETRIEKQIYHY